MQGRDETKQHDETPIQTQISPASTQQPGGDDDNQSHEHPDNRGETMDQQLAKRYNRVRERIANAAIASNRRPEDIYLVAVTKHATPEQIKSLIALGHRDFGENRVQQLIQRVAMVEEYLERMRVLPNATQRMEARHKLQQQLAADGQSVAPPPTHADDPVRWHMIGHLQRNKARKAVPLCRLVHSVDSLRLAEEIQQVALKADNPIEVLVQVNCSEEPQKFGCPIAAARTLAEQLDTMINVRVRGLMTIAAQSDDPAVPRLAFSRCRELYEDIRRSGVGGDRFNILSMGMSNDFELAIEMGANIIRVGSAIFGMPAQQETTEKTSTTSVEST